MHKKHFLTEVTLLQFFRLHMHIHLNMYSLIHLSTHPPIHSSTLPLIHPYTHPPFHSFAVSLFHSSMHSVTHSSIQSLPNLLTTAADRVGKRSLNFLNQSKLFNQKVVPVFLIKKDCISEVVETVVSINNDHSILEPMKHLVRPCRDERQHLHVLFILC